MLLAARGSPAPAQDVAPGVHLILGGLYEDRMPDGNSVLFDVGPGLLVIDTGRHPRIVENVLARARAAGKPIIGIIARVDFVRAIPGHGAPMTRDAFAAYHRGFDNLIVCAGEAIATSVCVDRWIADLGAVLPPADHADGRAIIIGYTDRMLRNAERRRTQCA